VSELASEPLGTGGAPLEFAATVVAARRRRSSATGSSVRVRARALRPRGGCLVVQRADDPEPHQEPYCLSGARRRAPRMAGAAGDDPPRVTLRRADHAERGGAGHNPRPVPDHVPATDRRRCARPMVAPWGEVVVTTYHARRGGRGVRRARCPADLAGRENDDPALRRSARRSRRIPAGRRSSGDRAPGVGKSTITNELVGAAGRRAPVGVSGRPVQPLHRRGILGDGCGCRTNATDRGPTSGRCPRAGTSAGWPPRPAAVRVLEGGGCNVVLVETVGSGRPRSPSRARGHTLVLLARGGRRDPAVKAGILEIADVSW